MEELDEPSPCSERSLFQMKMYVNGSWVESPVMSPVVSPYSREVVDTVPEATSDQVDQALDAAERADRDHGATHGVRAFSNSQSSR